MAELTGRKRLSGERVVVCACLPICLPCVPWLLAANFRFLFQFSSVVAPVRNYILMPVISSDQLGMQEPGWVGNPCMLQEL